MHDTRLWRVVRHYTEQALGRRDLLLEKWNFWATHSRLSAMAGAARSLSTILHERSGVAHAFQELYRVVFHLCALVYPVVCSSAGR